jgi:hypothetical protein
MCGRSCCKDCSLKRVVDVALLLKNPQGEEELNSSIISSPEGALTRICEYCEVKLDNPQIEEFYELGKMWRMRENDITQKKLKWYSETCDEMERHIKEESESLTMAELDYQNTKTNLDNQRMLLVSDTNRINNFKEQIVSQCNFKAIEN